VITQVAIKTAMALWQDTNWGRRTSLENGTRIWGNRQQTARATSACTC